MNSKNLLASLASLSLAAVVLVTAPNAPAQPAAEKNPERRPAAREFPRGDRPQFGGGGAVGQAFQAGRTALLIERVLTDEQRTSLRDAMEKQREKTRDLEEKIRDKRKELLESSVVEKFDEKAVREKALEVGKLDAELTVLRAKAMSQMKPALSAEQIEKIKNPPPFEPGEFRRNLPGNQDNNNSTRPNRPNRGPRDENDLPPKPKSEN